MEARAAEPLLASAVLEDEELDALFEGLGVGKRRDGKIRVGTGVESVDNALQGGVVGGNIVGVWGEGVEVCRALLVDSLLKDPATMAAVVDTTGNFDVLGVYTSILGRLRKDGAALAEMRKAVVLKEEDTVEDVAAKVLDRVKMMRVFDFVGVREAIGEIKDDLEDRKVFNRNKDETRQAYANSPKRPTPEPLTPEPLPKRTVVADSEDEDEDEEMLFDTSAPAQESVHSATQNAQPDQHIQTTTTETNPDTKPEQEETTNKVTFILIDNLAQVLNPLLKKDYVQANALSSTFLQSLKHLTRTYTLYTILANPSTSPRPVSPARQAQSNVPQQAKQQPPPPPSIFASNALLPSLSSVLARYVDVGLLVSRLPKRKMDAKVYYRDGSVEGGGTGKKLRDVEMVGVVEVMSDRWEGRVGGWGTL